MTPRIATGVAVTALIRRLEAAGGSAMVLAKGDATAGALLLVIAERGQVIGARERLLGPDGAYAWSPSGPADPEAVGDWVGRRRRSDPDLWVVELDHPDAADIAAALLA